MPQPYHSLVCRGPEVDREWPAALRTRKADWATRDEPLPPTNRYRLKGVDKKQL